MKESGALFKVVAILFLIGEMLWAKPLLTVQKVEGTVEIAKEKKEKWKAAKVGKPLKAQELLRTQASSGVELKYEDGSLLFVGEQTQITVREVLDSLSRHVEINKGQLRFDVRKLAERESFKFLTPTATASIRGTQCDMATNIRQSLIGCREGKVQFANQMGADSAMVCTGCILLQKAQSGTPVLAFVPNPTEFERILAELMDALFLAEDYDLDPDSLFNAVGIFNPVEITVFGDVDSTLSYLLYGKPGDTLWVQAPAQGVLNGKFYDFTFWESKGDSVEVQQPKKARTSIISLGGSAILKARYESVVYQMNVENQNCKVIGLEEPYQVDKGQKISFDVVGNKGFVFYKLSYDPEKIEVSQSSAHSFEIQPLADSTSLGIICKENLKNLSAQIKGKGKIIPSGPWVVSEEENLQVRAVPDSGYQFVGWEYEGVQLDRDSSATVNIRVLDSNATLNARFEAIPESLAPLHRLELEFFNERGESKTLMLDYR